MAKAIPEETRQGVAADYLAGMTPREIKEKEPAAAATATDSDVKTLQIQDSTKTTESQALEAAKNKLLAIYETLTPEETRAWELGEVYADIVRGLGE